MNCETPIGVLTDLKTFLVWKTPTYLVSEVWVKTVLRRTLDIM